MSQDYAKTSVNAEITPEFIPKIKLPKKLFYNFA